MQIVAQILFIIALVAGIGFFAKNIKRVIRNVKLGKQVDRSDKPGERFAKMILMIQIISFMQGK